MGKLASKCCSYGTELDSAEINIQEETNKKRQRKLIQRQINKQEKIDNEERSDYYPSFTNLPQSRHSFSTERHGLGDNKFLTSQNNDKFIKDHFTIKGQSFVKNKKLEDQQKFLNKIYEENYIENHMNNNESNELVPSSVIVESPQKISTQIKSLESENPINGVENSTDSELIGTDIKNFQDLTNKKTSQKLVLQKTSSMKELGLVKLDSGDTLSQDRNWYVSIDQNQNKLLSSNSSNFSAISFSKKNPIEVFHVPLLANSENNFNTKIQMMESCTSKSSLRSSLKSSITPQNPQSKIKKKVTYSDMETLFKQKSNNSLLFVKGDKISNGTNGFRKTSRMTGKESFKTCKEDNSCVESFETCPEDNDIGTCFFDDQSLFIKKIDSEKSNLYNSQPMNQNGLTPRSGVYNTRSNGNSPTKKHPNKTSIIYSIIFDIESIEKYLFFDDRNCCEHILLTEKTFDLDMRIDKAIACYYSLTNESVNFNNGTCGELENNSFISEYTENSEYNNFIAGIGLDRQVITRGMVLLKYPIEEILEMIFKPKKGKYYRFVKTYDLCGQNGFDNVNDSEWHLENKIEISGEIMELNTSLRRITIEKPTNRSSSLERGSMTGKKSPGKKKLSVNKEVIIYENTICNKEDSIFGSCLNGDVNNLSLNSSGGVVRSDFFVEKSIFKVEGYGNNLSKVSFYRKEYWPKDISSIELRSIYTEYYYKLFQL